MEELDRGGHEPAFPDHWFDDDRGHLVRSDVGGEDSRTPPRRVLGGDAPVGVGEGGVVDASGEWPEALLVGRHLASEGHGHHRPPVEAALECDHPTATGGVAGDLDGVLHCLSSRVHEERLLGAGPREASGELLSQLDDRFVGVDHEAGVAETSHLFLHSLGDRGVGMAGIGDGDASTEVDVAGSFDVPHFGVESPVNVDRVQARPPVGEDGFPTFVDACVAQGRSPGRGVSGRSLTLYPPAGAQTPCRPADRTSPHHGLRSAAGVDHRRHHRRGLHRGGERPVDRVRGVRDRTPRLLRASDRSGKHHPPGPGPVRATRSDDHGPRTSFRLIAAGVTRA